MTRAGAALVLAGRFAAALAVSAWATAWLIFTEPGAPRRGFARLDCAGLSETGMVVLAALVTLTPGTSAVDIDPGAGELYLHLLDTADLDNTLAGIRREFLAPVRVLFGGRS